MTTGSYNDSAYEKAGDAKAAGVQKERMEKAASEAGIYSPEMPKIDGLLSR